MPFDNNNKLPVVIIHTGYKDYLKINLEITGKENKIYLIGDESVKKLDYLKNVTYVDIKKYKNLPLIVSARSAFVNYSSNYADFEWLCFERIFILKFFMEEYKISSVFHTDSDNILLRNISTYPFTKDIAYCLCKSYHAERMSNSVHVGLLNTYFCEKFIELYNDIYVNKQKFNLIENKVNYHKSPDGKHYVNGGVCDMTLYYIMATEKIVDVENLLEPKDGGVFLHNINNGEGNTHKQQYRLKNNVVDISFTYTTPSCTVHDEINGIDIKLFNIHFQGTSKSLMTEQLLTQLGYWELEKLGTDYGGWYVPKNMNLNSDSIVYSGGVGEDISFDLLLQTKYDCNIVLIDPTTKSIKHYNEVKQFYTKKIPFSGCINSDYYPRIASLHPNLEKICYIDIGLWNCKDTLKFYKQTNEDYVSQSLIQNMFGSEYDVVPVDTIKNVMNQHNHTHIDLLKLDIEGAEIEVINQMLDDHIYPSYILVELDLMMKKKDPDNNTKRLIDRLVINENYRMIKNDNWNVTCVRVPK